MTAYKIAVLPGDGVGPEIVEQGIKVLRAFEQKFGVGFELEYAPIGGTAVDSHGVPLPEDTLKLAQTADAVYLGAVGDFKYDTLDPQIRPEQGLLQIRKAMALYSNLRPVKAYESLLHVSTLKPHVLEGVDLLVVRELTGGLYFGQPKSRDANQAVDTMVYTREEIERIARLGFESAMSRRKKLTSVDKANVLATSQLWREVVAEVAKDYPEVTVDHMYVDNAAMQLLLNPRQFDVLLTENTFGDILSDEAAMLIGSLGMLPSASLGPKSADGRHQALYESSHGSVPQLKGQNKVNPIAQILSLAMLLDYSFGMTEGAAQIGQAADQVLKAGYRTLDIAAEGSNVVGTSEMGDQIAAALLKLPEKVAS